MALPILSDHRIGHSRHCGHQPNYGSDREMFHARGHYLNQAKMKVRLLIMRRLIVIAFDGVRVVFGHTLGELFELLVEPA